MKRSYYGMAVLLAAGVAAGGVRAQTAGAGPQIAWAAGSYFESFRLSDAASDGRSDGRTEAQAAKPADRAAGEPSPARPGGPGDDAVLLVDLQIPLPSRAKTEGDNGYVYTDGGWNRSKPDGGSQVLGDMVYGGSLPLIALDSTAPDTVFPALNDALGVPETLFDLSEDADKITVFTPRMAGTQLGVSYTSEPCQGLGCSGISVDDIGPIAAPARPADVLELGLNYAARLSGVDLAVYGAYGRGDPLDDRPLDGVEEQDQWDMGLSLGYGGWLLAARYRHEDEGVAFDNLARQDWAVGVHYQPGPWRWGVQYLNSRPESDMHQAQTADAFEIGGAYDLAPGMLVTGGMQYWDVQDPFAPTGVEGNTMILILGTAITF